MLTSQELEVYGSVEKDFCRFPVFGVQFVLGCTLSLMGKWCISGFCRCDCVAGATATDGAVGLRAAIG